MDRTAKETASNRFVVVAQVVCPDPMVEPRLATRGFLARATIELAADGVSTTDSLLVSDLNVLGFNAASALVPIGATLTSQMTAGLPDGSVLAAGSDPRTASWGDLPILGTDSESTGAYALLISVPAAPAEPTRPSAAPAGDELDNTITDPPPATTEEGSPTTATITPLSTEVGPVPPAGGRHRPGSRRS